MAVFTVAYIAASFVLANLGGFRECGLVYANILNMLCRTVYSLAFSRRWWADRGLGLRISQALPQWHVLGVAVLAGATLRWQARDGVDDVVRLFATTVMAGVACLSVM
jgi:oligosaccharide translocation protein RFT1